MLANTSDGGQAGRQAGLNDVLEGNNCHPPARYLLSLVGNIAKQELQLFIRCGFFDHPDLQSLKQLHIVFIGLPTDILRTWGLLIYRSKGLGTTFPAVYYTPKKALKSQPQNKKEKTLQSFSDCRSGWSKEPQWENDCGSFLQCLLLCVLAMIG